MFLLFFLSIYVPSGILLSSCRHCISKPRFVFQSRTTYQNTNTFGNLHLGNWPVLNSGVYRQAILGFYLKLKDWLNKINRHIFLKPPLKSCPCFHHDTEILLGTLTTIGIFGHFTIWYVSKDMIPIKRIISLTLFWLYRVFIFNVSSYSYWQNKMEF